MECSICHQRITAVRAEVDPRRAVLVFLAGCGHLIARDEAKELWRRGIRWHTPNIDGATIVAAERARQAAEEGYTPQHDAQHEPDALPWAAWSYLDRAASGSTADPEPPKMWPWEPEAWKPDKSPMRMLIIAGALIAAEIDRRLAAGERP